MSKLISLGQLIDQSWELYRARFHELMSIAGCLLLLAFFYLLSLSLYPSASTLWLSNELNMSENVGVLLFIFTQYLLAPLLGVFVVIALSRFIKNDRPGTAGNIKKCFAQSRSLFIPTLITTFMVAFLLIVALLIGFGPSIVLTSLGLVFKSTLLLVIGNLLLIAGVFVALILIFRWMVEYYFAPYITTLEGIKGKKALLLSRQTVKGNFWEILIRLIVPKLVFIFFGFVLMAVIGYITSIILNVTSGLNFDLRLRLNTLIEWTLPVLIGMLINPLIVIADVLLYKSLKEE